MENLWVHEQKKVANFKNFGIPPPKWCSESATAPITTKISIKLHVSQL